MVLMCFHVTVHQEQLDQMMFEEDGDKGGTETTMELPVLEMEMSDQNPDDSVVIRQEEFAEIIRGNKGAAEELKDKKVLLSICIGGRT